MAFEYRNLAYTSPSGVRLQFEYNGELSDGKTHNLSEFQFANTDEKYFQDRTIASDGFSFLLSVTDQETLRTVRKAFDEKAEPGLAGLLEHPDPTIGSFPAVVGSVKYDQNTVNGIGVVRISVIFFKQIPNLIGGDISDATNPASASATYDAISAINETQAAEFAASVSTSTGSGFSALVANATKAVNAAKSKLGAIASKVDAVNILFTNTAAEILSTADDLARAPFDLARQIQNLIQLPMLAVDSVQDRIAAYKEYVTEVLHLSSDDEKNIEYGNAQGKNALAVSGLSALSAVSGIVFSAVTGQSATLSQIQAGEITDITGYLSRMDIISAINQVQETSLLVTETLSNYAALFGSDSFFNQYFDYSVLNKNLIAASIRNLNSRIFTAQAENIYVTERDINIVVLCAMLYNSVEVNTVKFLIESNNLHGSMIYLVPKMTEIKYYK